MPILSVLTQPWCWFSLLLLIVLLLVAAALVSRSRRHAEQMRNELPALPIGRERTHELTASAPFEALQALEERLAELQRHTPPDSTDARWLQSFRNDLRNVTDDLYWELSNGSAAQREALLERLGLEVERFERTVSQRLTATISGTTDHETLRRQLEQLRRSINR